MTTYKIKIDYTTGDSFDTERVNEYIDEIEWKDLNKAKENLTRIKNHYLYHKKYDDLWAKPKEAPPLGVKWNDKYRSIILELITDYNEPYLYFPFWIGYFEILHKAEIKIVDESLSYVSGN